ncbi:SDR family NAD(P)-dependent oxidoreductase [Actinomycetota bacterium]
MIRQFSLEGRNALVTGGNGGLGRAMALGLQSAGARVAITGRNPRKNEAVVAELTNGMTVQVDIREEAEVERAVSEVVSAFGSLDILINNAGIVHGQPILELSKADWVSALDTNLTGSFLCAKHAGRAMVAQASGGKIINIGSIYSIYGTPSYAEYGASKAGVLGLTRALAIELAPHDIQVNAILPGWYETDMTQDEIGTARGEEIRRKTPAGRWGNPEDLVGAAVFLASAASSFVTGVALPVDGGYLISESMSPT